MLEIQKLSAGYPGKPVLVDLTAQFPSGQITVILGPNGCGKTTLLKAMCGILPAQGSVLLDGLPLLTMPPRKRAQQVAYLSQSRQIPDLTAGYLVLCGRYPHTAYPRHYTAQDEAAAKAALETMGISDLAQCPMAQLSGGQRQKVYIAMALAQDAPVILLDEPGTYLDISHQLQLQLHLRTLAQQGKTVVAVLHDLQSALHSADRTLLMEEGRIVTQGTPEEVFLSGALNRVFGVSVNRAMIDGQWRYFCK